jgi:hypothetical protein
VYTCSTRATKGRVTRSTTRKKAKATKGRVTRRRKEKGTAKGREGTGRGTIESARAKERKAKERKAKGRKAKGRSTIITDELSLAG